MAFETFLNWGAGVVQQCWASDSQDLLPDVKRVKARSNQLYPRLVRTSVSSTWKVPDSSSSTWNPWNHWLKLLSNSCFDTAVEWYLIPMRFEFLLGADRIWLYCSSAVCLTVYWRSSLKLPQLYWCCFLKQMTQYIRPYVRTRTYIHIYMIYINMYVSIYIPFYTCVYSICIPNYKYIYIYIYID